jgi:hypothetical protein
MKQIKFKMNDICVIHQRMWFIYFLYVAYNHGELIDVYLWFWTGKSFEVLKIIVICNFSISS